MAFFDEQQLAALSIERMVFHLVGPSDGDFVRLEEVSPGKFEEFFLELIRHVNSGTPYSFSDASATRERLSRILATPDVFQEESERLADDFHRKHGGSTSKGAFLVFVLRSGAEQTFALLKYDDEEVVAYDMKDGAGGRKRVTLDALERTFVQNREALQKSALIRLTDTGGELRVLDRRNQQRVALYFEAFLDAVRIHEDAELTEKLVKVTREVLRDSEDLVPPDVYRELTKRTYDAAALGVTLDADDQKGFLDTVMGRKLADNDELVTRFKRALRRARIEGVPVTLDPSNVRRPSSVRYMTVNQIQIRVPIDKRDFVEVEADRIIVNDRLDRQYDDADGAS